MATKKTTKTTTPAKILAKLAAPIKRDSVMRRNTVTTKPAAASAKLAVPTAAKPAALTKTKPAAAANPAASAKTVVPAAKRGRKSAEAHEVVSTFRKKLSFSELVLLMQVFDSERGAEDVRVLLSRLTFSELMGE